MSIAFSGRIGEAILSDDEKFVTVWDGQVLEEEWLVLIKGAPNEAPMFLSAPIRSIPWSR